MRAPIPATLLNLSVPVAKLKPYGHNPRRGDLAQIKASLVSHGQYRPIVVRAGTFEVLAGNHTLAAARELGWTSLAATFVDVDDEEAARIVLVDNRSNDLATYDDRALTELLASLPTLDGTGFDQGAIDALVAGLRAPTAALTDPDAIPEPPARPAAKPGDVWRLGSHRLACGDATKAADVERLLGEARPTLLLTDPPYGVELDMEWRDRAGHNDLAPANRSYMKIAMGGKGISGDTRGDWSEAFALVPSIRVAYVWHATSRLIEVGQGLQAIGFELRQQIIWVKTVAAMSRSAYHWKHEPCWYAVRKGATADWHGSRDQVTVWEAASPKHIMGGSKEAKFDHPTQKPVALFERPIENHLDQGGRVYEPFAGSGTTLIACERLSRLCYAMEIEPRYVDITCRRFQEFTGIRPILEATGEEHDFSGQ